MIIFRTRFAREIVTEFLPPSKNSNKVIILCTGMPSYPGRRNELLEFLSSKGFWVFLPRYRGTWESDGVFMKKSPHEDILDIIEQLPKGFIDLWSGKKYSIKKPRVFLVGSSFGGPAAILASTNSRVEKVVALSPVINWTIESKVEPIDWIGRYTQSAFGCGYRFSINDWDKLKTGKFYNPITAISDLDNKKLLVIHANNDEVVYVAPVKDFVQKLGCAGIFVKSGGHLSISNIQVPRFWKRIRAFLDA
ncbi:MAG: prolyl oligopeptidase family serine peptidase [Candidatus Taylorbacteria bacterium]